MALFVHPAESTQVLADGLGDLLTGPLPDPFAQEVVAVPTRGVERWLAQRLSHRLGAGPAGSDGVCAGVRFLNPQSLVAMVLDRDRDDPWHPDHLVWPLLDTIDASLHEPWCAPLATHLGHGRTGHDAQVRQARRYAVSRRIAGLFASYAVQRPTVVTDWREGRDTDGAGGALTKDLRWQPELWRHLLDRVQAEPPDVRHTRVLHALGSASGADGLDLPDRLSLFGHTRLPVTEVELLHALAQVRDVHLWLPHPSSQLWDELDGVAAQGPVRRRDDRSARLVHHPLLASLGRDTRELRRTLGQVEARCAPVPHAPHPTLLGWLQHDLRSDTDPRSTAGPGRQVSDEDRTVQVHACHGPARQVEVLREVLTGLLADDPSLEPRDILVMCPDIESYAPLIQAGFGLGEVTGVNGNPGHPGHQLRVLLADRALTSTNPLLAVAARLVDLTGARVSATQVLDLASLPVVRRRFGFSTDDLETLTGWTRQANIRWGLDQDHRDAYQVSTAANTWRFGLDRLLAGVALSEDDDHGFEAALPVDAVPSGSIDLLGRFAELLDRLDHTLRQARSARTAAQWTDILTVAVHALTDVPAQDAWQRAQLDRELGEISAQAGDTPLAQADLRALLAHRSTGRATRANFRTGTLTVCTMLPMRSVPHRVVCLLGLDDGSFPRTIAVDGDDVLAVDPMTGERDPRSEDRQLLLDAVLAATQTLVVTYTGANEHTGAPRPPAVPLGELIDAVLATAPIDRDRLVTRHPLQPFDRVNFETRPRDLDPAPGLVRPFSFDRGGLTGAQAALAPRTTATTLLDTPLPGLRTAEIALTALHRFFRDPAAAFLRDRLDVATPRAVQEVADAIPLTLGPLEKWDLADRMLQRLLAGTSPDVVCTAELRRGQAPPGPIGEEALHNLASEVQALYAATAPLRRATARPVDIDIDLGDGRRLTGTVSVHGDAVIRAAYSRLGAKHRLASWIDLLVLAVAHPQTAWTAHAIGRPGSGKKGSSALHATCGPIGQLEAIEHLGRLVQIYDLGHLMPVPLPPRTALAFAEAAVRESGGEPVDPREKAERQWQTDRDAAYGIPGENNSAAHERLYGRDAPLSVLLGTPRPEESWNDQPTRLARYALAVWGPLLTGAERVSGL